MTTLRRLVDDVFGQHDLQTHPVRDAPSIERSAPPMHSADVEARAQKMLDAWMKAGVQLVVGYRLQ